MRIAISSESLRCVLSSATHFAARLVLANGFPLSEELVDVFCDRQWQCAQSYHSCGRYSIAESTILVIVVCAPTAVAGLTRLRLNRLAHAPDCGGRLLELLRVQIRRLHGLGDSMAWVMSSALLIVSLSLESSLFCIFSLQPADEAVT